MTDHYSDRIATPHKSHQPAQTWEFDATGLAVAIAQGRRRLELSTRELSRRAGISQPYVVALERARESALRRGPNPTVDVIARLAHALQIEPARLFTSALRQVGRHALLVVEDGQRSVLEHVHAVTRDNVETWVWAASSTRNKLPAGDAHCSINLRRDSRQAYEPAVLAESLVDELQQLVPALEGHRVGFVFADTSAVMSTLDDPQTIISFEHEWADVVNKAAVTVGAQAAWNICVYEMSALKLLQKSLESTLDLMRSHDTVWSARRRDVLTGAPAAHRILDQLRPSAVKRSAWQTTTERLVNDLGLVA